jgi:hypothetical protein
VRLAGAGAKAGSVAIAGLSMKATSPGTWSSAYGVKITKSPAGDRFSLEVLRKQDGKELNDANFPPKTIELYDGLSMLKGDSRFVRTILDTQSAVVTIDADPAPATPIPEDKVYEITPGNDGPDLASGGAAFGTALTADGSGYHLLETVDLVNLLCVPGFAPDATTKAQLEELEKFCSDRRALLLVDGKPSVAPADSAKLLTDQPLAFGENAALYYPWISAPDPLNAGSARDFPPSGFVAGIFARTDASRGVWKAPAGTEAKLVGVIGASRSMTDIQNGRLNKAAINCVRDFAAYGTIVWGARTLAGNDDTPSEWKYVPVRRTALFLEETLFRALKWVVFEPNDEPLWAQIRLNVGAFMQTLFRQGAFQGQSPQEAYFVKCDKETTTQNDINLGIVNIHVGFAPLKPAEFVVVQIQQLAGQIAA